VYSLQGEQNANSQKTTCYCEAVIYRFLRSDGLVVVIDVDILHIINVSPGSGQFMVCINGQAVLGCPEKVVNNYKYMLCNIRPSHGDQQINPHT
jgi:hypothetical protein